MTHKMWFNTGVKPYNISRNLSEHEAIRGGTLQIAFYLESEPPKGASLKWLCDNPEPGHLAIKVVDGGMLSDYAVFSNPINP